LAPAKPTGLKAEIGTYNNVKLTWNANIEVDLGGYEIAYLKSGTGVWAEKSIDAGVTSITIEGLTQNVPYSFKIKAKDLLNNKSEYTSTVSATPKDRIAPAAPKGLTLKPQDRSIVLTWAANTETDISVYQLEYKVSTASTWSIISSSLSRTMTTYTKTSLVNGTTYQFRLKAKDTSSNWSGYTEIITGIPLDNVAPPVPSGLKVSSVNDRRITLGWTTVSATDLAGYVVEYQPAGAIDWTDSPQLGKVTSYTINGLENELSYNFRICSVDTSGNLSGYSATITGVPVDKMPPSIPTGLTAAPGIDRDISLTWNRNPESDFAQYELFYQKYGTTTWIPISLEAGMTSAKIEGLTHNIKYSFKLRAKDFKGNWSNYSAVIYAIAKDIVPPSTPVITSIDPSDRSLIVRWNANTESDLGGYQLEYKTAVATTWIIKPQTKIVTSYKLTYLTNGTVYLVRLKAQDAVGNWSGYTEILTGIPMIQ
jgi:chitodextrinase